MSVAIDVLGTPAPKGSSRPMLNRKTGKPFTFAGGSKVAEVKLGAWDGAVRAAAAVAVTDRIPFVDVPLTVAIVFRIARPPGHWAKRVGIKPGKPVVPRGKPGPAAPHGARQGINDYTGWFASDAAMSGDYYGYDGPCPPWNDELPHRYVFTVFALDVSRLSLPGRFGGHEGRTLRRGDAIPLVANIAALSQERFEKLKGKNEIGRASCRERV